MHDVLPPNSIVEGPGVAMDPRVPQKRRITVHFLRLARWTALLSNVLQINIFDVIRQSAQEFADLRGVLLQRGSLDRAPEFRELRESVTGASALHLVRQVFNRVKVIPGQRS